MADYESLFTVEFSPAEAAKVTGVSAVLQRVWRGRNLLQPSQSEGHARFRLPDLCRLYAMKAFSDVGVGPRRSNSFEPEGCDIMSPAGATIMAVPMMLHFAALSLGLKETDHDMDFRFVVIEEQAMGRTASLASYEKARMKRKSASPLLLVFDTKLAAEKLLASLPRSPISSKEASR
ncbi:HTH merR-type domain-containing protein [Hyphomicrobiales bacterium]|jgi:hypothetical protein|nr:HTH merR-type domain-containing protein [Hyphomicrobiales bacterium]CAH1702819.1 putative MerR family transcriptional regulator [Hyphomicrobiales bacterium]CAI0347008.1 HTH merR-type domain-containing protein [Hyphomicrobiales bacterium]